MGTKSLISNLQKATAHLKSFDNIAAKISKKGVIQAKDVADILNEFPELAAHMTPEIEKGIVKLDSAGMKLLKDQKDGNKQIIEENAKGLQDRIAKEQEYYLAVSNYIGSLQAQLINLKSLLFIQDIIDSSLTKYKGLISSRPGKLSL